MLRERTARRSRRCTRETSDRDAVREAYAATARGSEACCVASSSKESRADIGYSAAEMEFGDETGTDLVLGCGNPVSLAQLAPGEVVVDLGSGAGLDCLLAARKVGGGGLVIGVDMVPEMLARARAAAKAGAEANVSFRLGEIEHVGPVADASADAVISNCVINLSADKPQVVREAARVLRPGGRIAISDVIRTRARELPERLQTEQALALSGGGAALGGPGDDAVGGGLRVGRRRSAAECVVHCRLAPRLGRREVRLRRQHHRRQARRLREGREGGHVVREEGCAEGRRERPQVAAAMGC